MFLQVSKDWLLKTIAFETQTTQILHNNYVQTGSKIHQKYQIIQNFNYRPQGSLKIHGSFGYFTNQQILQLQK